MNLFANLPLNELLHFRFCTKRFSIAVSSDPSALPSTLGSFDFIREILVTSIWALVPAEGFQQAVGVDFVVIRHFDV
jgi:hypothetical protein